MILFTDTTARLIVGTAPKKGQLIIHVLIATAHLFMSAEAAKRVKTRSSN